MNNNLLYISDTLISLPEGFEFATNVKRVDFNSLRDRSVNYTNSVKLQWTPDTQILFGFAWNEKTGASVMYTQLPCRLVQNGVETIPGGFCRVSGVDELGVTIAIFENSINIMKTIEGRKLNRLSHIADSGWLAADIDAARLATSGLINAIVGWGKPNGGNIFNVDFWLPCFFYHDTITTILEQTGLTLSGTVLTRDDFLNLVYGYGLGKWEYPDTVNQDYRFTVFKKKLTKTINIAADGGSPSTEVIEIDGDDEIAGYAGQGGARIWDIATYKATIPDTGSNNAWLRGTIGGTVYLNITSWNPGDEFSVSIRVFNRLGDQIYITTIDVDYATYGAAPVTGLPLAFPAIEVALSDGDQIDMVAHTKVGSGSGAITIAARSGTPPADAITLYFAPISGTVSRASVRWQLLLPDMLQSEIVKDFFVRFGIIHNELNGVLYLKTIREITEDVVNAVSWTDKRVEKGDQLNYSPASYAQDNAFSYTPDSGAGNQPDKEAGTGSLYTYNQNLQGRKPVYQTPFESLRDIAVNVTAASCHVYDTASADISDFDQEPGLRLMMLRDKEAGDPVIRFNAALGLAGDRSDYRVANFKSNGVDMGWSYFLNTYYGPAFITALRSLRFVTRTYMLTETDVASYDPHKMIYDNGSYFIVSVITNFIPGRPTKVELLKII